ncbi:MAG TPA: ZIP family zinc transporter [Candidatus Dormibacteraeota bacterium]|nr:ZIP family zinc transporter [Candidatus Dormibacteraeota bacterium]
MIEAFVWGALGASALALGALISYGLAPGRRVVAGIMAVGSGVLIGSVAFELIDEALKTRTVAWVALLVLVGALTFAVGDWLVDRHGASERKDQSGKQADGSPLAIVLGSVLDGIPESFVLGLTVLQGAVSVSLFAGIVLSNLPEGMSSSSGLRVAGWSLARVLRMWLLVIVGSAIAAAAGYGLLDPESRRTGALAQAFAAGALLAMVADALLPEAYEVEGVWTGLLVVVGFAISLALDAL